YCLARRRPPTPSRLPYTTLFRSRRVVRLVRLRRVLALLRRGLLPGRGPHEPVAEDRGDLRGGLPDAPARRLAARPLRRPPWPQRSEEHTSELQSRENLVCRLLLE